MAFLNLHGLSTFLNELKTNFVNSFNGRKGNVSPTKGDYSIDKISPTSGATEGQIPVLVNNGTDLEFEMQDVPSGGHAILNPAGTEMTQRDDLQFSGYFTVSDDSTNGKTVVSDEWETISWTSYNALTDQQRAGRHFKITGAPTSGLTAGIVSYDNTSSGSSATDVQDAIDELFSGSGSGGGGIGTAQLNVMMLRYVVSMNSEFKLNEGSYLAIRFTGANDYPGNSKANLSFLTEGIIPVKVDGNIIPDEPTIDPETGESDRDEHIIKAGETGIFVYDGTYLNLVAKSISGHSIEDASGQAVTQRNTFRFFDSHVSDDSTNGRTIVENVKEVTLAELSQATERGMYLATDEESVPIGEIEEDVVSVTADGVKTWATLLNELWSEIDSSKVTDNALFIYDTGTNRVIYNFYIKTNNTYAFYLTRTSNSNISNGTVDIRQSNSRMFEGTISTSATTISNISSNVPTNGTVITLHYGTSSGIVELNTDARHCMMSDGVTSVESAINSISYKKAGFSGTTNADGELVLTGFEYSSGYRILLVEDCTLPNATYNITHGSNPNYIVFKSTIEQSVANQNVTVVFWYKQV